MPYKNKPLFSIGNRLLELKIRNNNNNNHIRNVN